MAVWDQCTIVLIVHPNRLPQHQQRRVTIRDLKGASAIEQDAHLGLVVVPVKPKEQGGALGARIHVDKCRDTYGTVGSSAFLYYDLEACVFADKWDTLPEARFANQQPPPPEHDPF
jgi:hypothetical protein